MGWGVVFKVIGFNLSKAEGSDSDAFWLLKWYEKEKLVFNSLQEIKGTSLTVHYNITT